MKASVLLRPLAASVFLFAAACGGSGQSTDASNAAANEALANLDEALPEEGNAVAEEVALVGLPPAPADAPATETAPLTQAAAIATEIATDNAVERVPYEGGWAWRRDGRIIRTASRDGRRVSWFRPSETTPFLVQQGDETFAYQGGRPQRAFDRRGRPGAVTPQRQEEARRLAEQSRRDRDQAARAPRRPDNDRGRPGGNDSRPDRSNDGRPDRGGPDRGGNSSAGRDDRGGDRNGTRRDDDRRDDRRQRGSDDTGNRQ